MQIDDVKSSDIGDLNNKNESNVEESFTIKPGDYVIVQRQGYTKLHKLKSHGTLSLGNFVVEMDNVVGEKYYTTFQMKNLVGNKKSFTLEKVDDITSSTSNIKLESSGIDNRHITDDGQSQRLTRNEISKLKNEEFGSNSIVEKLITNSTTFSSKTEYSQEKYIKKKEKKYFEFVQILKPTIRLLVQMFYRQDPTKTLGIKIDDLSQILAYANVQCQGTYLLYDSGTSGLLPAALLNSIGKSTQGHVIHIHPGNECQKTAFAAMQFPVEQSNRCINVNLYSVLRHFYQNDIGEPESKRLKIEKKLAWQLENEKACDLLRNQVDALIIVAKDHPVSIVKELIRFLAGNRSIVVFSLMREPLQDLYIYLKSRVDFISLRLTSNFVRYYQVLPDRTHPEVNMTTGGYILSGFKLSN